MEWKLDQQLCFLLYANSRNIIKMYKSNCKKYKNIYYKPAIDYSEARKETLKEMYRIAKL